MIHLKNRRTFCVFLIFSTVLVTSSLLSCKKDNIGDVVPTDVEDVDDGEEGLSYEEWQKGIAKRAEALVKCPWTPSQDIKVSAKGSYPYDYFKAGISYDNIPYGGGTNEKYYTYVGTNISFYTFLSAVNNPKSFFYSADARTDIGRVVYGNVCTATVSYCWGIPSSFNTWDAYNNLVPYLKKLTIKSAEELILGDTACWYHKSIGGHIFIITDITKDRNGRVQSFTTTEAQDGRVHNDTYTVKELQSYLDTKDKNVKKISGSEKGVMYFRFNFENYRKYLKSPDFIEQERVTGYTFPDALCTFMGDKVSYPYGQSVTINILSDKYTSLQLYKGDEIYQTLSLNGKTEDVVLANLPVGLYKACLTDGTNKSTFTYFQVGGTSFTATKSGENVLIEYSDTNSDVQYITLKQTTDGTGGVFRYADKIKDGLYKCTWSLGGATQIKVQFAGKYSTYGGATVSIK